MRRLWCNPDIGLIGRRSLLERRIKPRVHNDSLRFILSGSRNVGKTALLEAAFDLCTNKKCLINAGRPFKSILEQLISDWSISIPGDSKKKPTVEIMKSALLSCSGHTLFIDDLHKTSSASKIDFFRTLADRHKIHGAILGGAGKENLKPLLSKLGKEIYVPPLNRQDSLKLAEKISIHLGSSLSLHKI